jgi:1-phosphofructokinase/tagatose 6-phosphate kinase
MCVFAGSLPRGMPDGSYAEMVIEMKRLGVMTIVDAEGDPMDMALRAGPDLVSPNDMEAEELAGHEFRDEQDRVFALFNICELGPREAIITHEAGCVALLGRERERRNLYEVRTDRLEPVSAIGAGDAFLAGFLAACSNGDSPGEALRFAVACGAESTMHMGAGVLDPRGAERMMAEVEVAEIEQPKARA